MRKFIFAAFLLVFGAALPAAGQALLPNSVANWTARAPAAQFTPRTLDQLAGETVAVLREYGFRGAEQRTYQKGADSLVITLYRMKDPTAAYGAFTYLRTPQMAAAKLTEYSALGGGRALVVEGNLLLDIAGANVPRLKPALKPLLAALDSHADHAPFPTLQKFLPPKGLIAGSEKYVAGPVVLHQLLPLADGDWLGFSDSAEAVIARYRIGSQEATLLLADYPTQQLAAKWSKHIEKRFGLGHEEALGEGPAPVYARRSSALIGLVAHSPSQTLATAILDDIHYESEVTWNEPTFSLTEPTIGQMIYGILVGTGIIILLALAAGLGFGGLRVIVKFFLPGKVFDRNERVEILQLGLSGKPIRANDFYGAAADRPRKTV